MSWFGWGGSPKKDDSSSTSTIKADDFDASSAFNNSSRSEYPSSSSGSLGDLGSSYGRGGMSNFEQELMMEQQKLMVQGLMVKLTDAAFDSCITKPTSSLSHSEKQCISAVVGKYLETSQLVVTRFQGGQQ